MSFGKSIRNLKGQVGGTHALDVLARASGDPIAAGHLVELDDTTQPGVTQVGVVDGVAHLVANLFGATIGNTTAETSALSEKWTAPAGGIEVGHLLRVTAWGQILQNTGSAANGTIRLKVGNVTILTGALNAIGSSASSRQWRMEAVVPVRDVIGVRTMASGLITLGSGTAGATDALSRTIGGETPVVDFTVPNVWDVTVQPSVAHANFTMSVNNALVEQIHGVG